MRSLNSGQGLYIYIYSISKTEAIMYDYQRSDQEIDRAKYIMKMSDD